MILRPWPFQAECLDAIWSAIGEGYQRFACVLPTGSGKTTIFTHLADQAHSKGRRVLILVERNELVKQTVRGFHSVAPDLSIGVIKASRKEFGRDITIASVQTLSRPEVLAQINPAEFNFIIVDECHHISADGYQRIIGYFQAFEDRFGLTPLKGMEWITSFTKTLVVGFTATLMRNDAKKLGDTFQTIPDRPKGVAYHKDILWMIRHGYLVNPFGKEITIDLDLGDVGRSAGDYQVGALGDKLIQAHAGTVVSDFIRDEASDRQCMVFAPNIESAENCLAVLKLRGFRAAAVYGHTADGDRDTVYSGIDSGEIQVFVNVGVGVEGFDKRHISCVILLHITQSIGRFVQMVGRGLRKSADHNPASPFPWIRREKTDCLVGLLGAQNGVRLATMVDLTESQVTEILPGESLLEAADREQKERDDAKPVDPLEDPLRYTDVDLFAQESRFRFRTTKKGYRYIPTKEWLVALYPHTDAPDTLYAVGKIWIGKGKPQKGQTVMRELEQGFAMAWAEEIAEQLDPVGTVAQKGAAWRKAQNAPRTALQMIKATQLSIPQPWPETKVGMSDLIDSVTGTKALDWYTPKPAPVPEFDPDDPATYPCRNPGECGCPMEAVRACPGRSED